MHRIRARCIYTRISSMYISMYSYAKKDCDRVWHAAGALLKKTKKGLDALVDPYTASLEMSTIFVVLASLLVKSLQRETTCMRIEARKPAACRLERADMPCRIELS